jgi:hypothetical protein
MNDNAKVIDLLEDLVALQSSPTVVIGHEITIALAAAVGFIISAGFTRAFSETFKVIFKNQKPLLSAWIYFIVAIAVGILLLFLIFKFVHPLFVKLLKTQQTYNLNLLKEKRKKLHNLSTN